MATRPFFARNGPVAIRVPDFIVSPRVLCIITQQSLELLDNHQHLDPFLSHLREQSIDLQLCTDADEYERLIDERVFTAVLIYFSGAGNDVSATEGTVRRIAAKKGGGLFVIVFSRSASESYRIREVCIAAGAAMVTASVQAILAVCQQLVRHRLQQEQARLVDLPSTYACSICGQSHLNEDNLCEHYQLHHQNITNKVQSKCPICHTYSDKKEPFAVHLHDRHGVVGRKLARNAQRTQGKNSTYAFALVVCVRDDGKMLLVQEPANWGWWLPGGRVDPGEEFQTAAIRETMEEAGLAVTLTGILRVEYSAHEWGNRLRVIFAAKPLSLTPGDDLLPKSIPDFESLGAVWATLEDVRELSKIRRLRGPEPLFWLEYLSSGGAIYPLGLLTRENADPRPAAASS